MLVATGVGTGNAAALTLALATNTPGASGTAAQPLADRVTITDVVTTIITDLRVNGNVGFYNQAAVAQPAAVPVTAIAIHAALVTLGLIT